MERVAVKSDQTGAPEGALPVRRARKPRPGEVIAARIVSLGERARPAVPVRGADGVVPLNPGFFALERMRASDASKARGKLRGKVRG